MKTDVAPANQVLAFEWHDQTHLVLKLSGNLGPGIANKFEGFFAGSKEVDARRVTRPQVAPGIVLLSILSIKSQQIVLDPWIVRTDLNAASTEGGTFANQSGFVSFEQGREGDPVGVASRLNLEMIAMKFQAGAG